MITDDLRTYLLADATISGLVGTRIDPNKLSQNPTLPAVTYTMISAQRPSNADSPAIVTGQRIQIDCWGSTYAQAVNVFEAIRKRLNGKSSGDIIVALLDNEREFYEPEPELYRRSADFMVWSAEATS